MHRVFCYGTLKRGFPNWQHLLDKPGVTFLGEAKTLPIYALLHLGGFPGMTSGGVTSVQGEVFEVDGGTLRSLDRLEGHPSFYQRLPVDLADAAKWPGVEAYLLPPSAALRHAVIKEGVWRK